MEIPSEEKGTPEGQIDGLLRLDGLDGLDGLYRLYRVLVPVPPL